MGISCRGVGEDAGFGNQSHTTQGGLAADAVAQRLAVDIRPAQGATGRLVFVGGEAGAADSGGIVDRGNGDIDGDAVAQAAVTHLDHELGGPASISHGGIAHQTISIDTGATLLWRGLNRPAQHITVHIRGAQIQACRGILAGGHVELLTLNDLRRIVHRGDGEADSGDAGLLLAVVGLEGEAVAAVLIERRGVDEGASAGIQLQGSHARCSEQMVVELLIVDILHIEAGADRLVLIGSHAAVARHRGIIERDDGERGAGADAP